MKCQLICLLLLICCYGGVCQSLTWINTLNGISIQEELKQGTAIGTLSATDSEASSSAGIQYGLNNNKDDINDNTLNENNVYFKINRNTGEVTIKNQFSRDGFLNISSGQIQGEITSISVTWIARKQNAFTKFSTNIFIRNINDEKPVFQNNSMIFEIDENIIPPPEGIAVKNDILITDVDGLFTGLINLNVTIKQCFFVTIVDVIDCPTWFKLTPSRGLTNRIIYMDLTLHQQLDYEKTPTIQVQLQADDGKQQTNTDVRIVVIDKQDTPPTWISLPADTSIDDNAEIGDLIIRTSAEDQDSVKRPIHYKFIEGQSNQGIKIDDVFQIDSSTGIVTNKVKLDLEDQIYFDLPNTKKRRDRWQIKILACEIDSLTNRPSTNVQKDCADVGVIALNIKDVNDNAPRFQLKIYRYTVFENAKDNTVLVQPQIVVEDADTDQFDNYLTVILQDSAEFALIGGDSTPQITVKDSSLLNWNTGPRLYNLTLRAYDILNTTLEDFAIVVIEVKDANDRDPAFRQLRYTASISEDSKEGDFVIQVQADDTDEGSKGKDGIKYRLFGDGQDLFSINDETGRITVKFCQTYGVDPCLDYDKEPRSYNFQVFAQDDNGNGREGVADLFVQLLNVNDNPPQVGNYNVFIFENERRFGGSGLFVQGTDEDPGTTLTYSILQQNLGMFWKIDTLSGEITVNKPNNEGIKFLDGTNGKFELTVAVSDSVYTTNSFVTINVIDINDQAPVFIPKVYRITIPDSTPQGEYLLTVTAQDADDPTSKNGQLEYSVLSGNIGGNFQLDEKSGNFLTTARANLKSGRDDYTILIRVQDLGSPQLEGNATIEVIITRTNSRDPRIKPGLQTFQILENSQIGTFVGKIKSEDPDDQALLVHSFTSDIEAYNGRGAPVNRAVFDFTTLFRLSPNGSIFVNSKLNSMKANVLTIGIKVEDINAEGTEPQIAIGTVIITVLPYNIDPPTFINLADNVTVLEELTFGTFVKQFTAIDSDGIQEYKLSGLGEQYFSIGERSGTLLINGRINYDDARKLNGTTITVTVTDKGEPQLATDATLQVIFANINDNTPEFKISPNSPIGVNIYYGTIKENSPDNTPVVQVFSIDNDRADENGFNLVRYSMNDNRFDVDPITGQVFVRLRNGSQLDRETNRRIIAQVIVKDNPDKNGPTQNQRGATVSISLTDVNDNPPRFTRDDFYVSVFESLPVGTDILQLFTTDLDFGDNALSIYRKVPNEGTDTEDLFGVQEQLGRVHVTKPLLGKYGRYIFYVQAQDNLGKGFITNASVTVDVMRSSNVPPYFVVPPMDNMTIEVLEEQYNGMLVFDVSARDDDSGPNGVVEYSFIYEGKVKQATPEFKINKITGVIQAEITYDRENINRYVLLLRASDRGETTLETTRFLTVIIKDVDDNVPRFPLNEVEFTVKENAPINFSVGQVTATDLDLNPIIKYKIIAGNGDGVFGINEDTGELYLVKTLDIELKQIYYLDVQATNNKPDYRVIRSRRKRAIDPSIVKVKVVVGDINDQAPQFLENSYYGCISTRSQFGMQILTVKAVDRDAIGTGIVRYSLNKTFDRGSEVGNDYFAVHPKFGAISNKVLMQSHVDKTFDLTVNARDGLNFAGSESSNVNVKIFVTQPGKEVKLQITQNTAEVRLYQSQIQSIIEQSNNIDYLCILNIEDHVIDTVGSTTTLWADVYVSGVRAQDDGTMEILGARELTNIIDYERTNRKNDFDLLYIKEVEAASSSDELDLDDKAVIIILIIIAVLIFLVIIFCIVAFMCIKAAKTTKKRRLVHKTNSPPAPLPVLMVEPELEPVIYDNRAFIQEVEVPSDPEPEVYHTEPVHVQYAVVNKGSSSPVEYTTSEYRTSDQSDYRTMDPSEYQVSDPAYNPEADDDVIVVALDDPMRNNDVQDVYEPDAEYRIETDLVQE